jgi:chemotaxis protein MotB
MANDKNAGGSPPPVPRSMVEPPPRRGRLILRLTLLCLLGFAGAAGAGYLWWTQRGEHDTALSQLKEQSWRAGECTRELGELQPKVDDLNRQVASCQTEKEGTVEKHRAVETMMTSMEANLQATREELEDLRVQRAEAEKRLAAFKDLTGKFQKMIDAGEIEVKFRNGSMLVAMPAEVLFPSGSADLSDPGKLAVLQVGAILKQIPGRRFMVVGHTDNLPLKGSSYKDNWQLSTARAVTVTQFLVGAGFDPKNLIAAGHGEHDPVGSNKSKEGRGKNRRIEILLLPDIGELPPTPSEEAGAGAKEPKGT